MAESKKVYTVPEKRPSSKAPRVGNRTSYSLAVVGDVTLRKGASPASVGAAIVVLAVVYLASGRLGLELAHYQTNATLIWPPTGLSIAALVLFGRRLWPGVFLGAAAVNFLIGTPVWAALGISAGNTLEAVVASLILTRWLRFDPALARARDVLVFGGAAAFASAISATVGAATLLLAGSLADRDPWVVWVIWWLGDMGGALLVAPLIFVFAKGGPKWRALTARKETWVVLSLTLVGSFAAFAARPGDDSSQWALPAVFLPFICVVWAGLRLGPRGAVGTAAAAATITVVRTGAGFGPFAGTSPDAAMLLSWAYATSIGAVAAILAGAIAERDTAEAARKAEEDQRRALEKQVAHAEELERLGLLAGGIAHDFNNLLMAVQGNVEVLRRSIPEAVDPMVLESMSPIGVATKRAAQLCRQLLDFSGRRSPNAESLSVAESVSEAISLVRGSIPRRVTIEVDVPMGLPRVDADAGQVNQILMNLLLNAGDAIASDAGAIRIVARVIDETAPWSGDVLPTSTGPHVELVVVDDGPGMDEATRRRVFEPFFSTKDQGRGLGLASVAGIVRGHGGAVRVRSAPGEGTEFAVLMPVSECESIIERENAREAPAVLGRVLLAEDDAAVRRVVERALQDIAADVTLVEDGREALEALGGDTPFDAAVLDVDMPHLDGTQVVRALRGRGDRLPILLVTGRPSPRLIALGEAYLEKPFSAAALKDALHEVVAAKASPGSPSEPKISPVVAGYLSARGRQPESKKA
ncbi:MAG: hypothetical protein DRJ42_23980 [Deltaproteobacteria bacterium]|nr:MAG: hypothetical protein DRJ42_23980 [Deltaproteobacteria bacterium]